MNLKNYFVLLISSCSLLFASLVSANIEVDKLMLRAQKSIAQNDWNSANKSFEKLLQLNLELPLSVYIEYAKSLKNAKEFDLAIVQMNTALSKIGSGHERYEESLRLLIDIEDAKEQEAQNAIAREQELKLEKEREIQRIKEEKIKQRKDKYKELIELLDEQSDSASDSGYWVNGMGYRINESVEAWYSVSAYSKPDLCSAKYKVSSNGHIKDKGKIKESTAEFDLVDVNTQKIYSKVFRKGKSHDYNKLSAEVDIYYITFRPYSSYANNKMIFRWESDARKAIELINYLADQCSK